MPDYAVGLPAVIVAVLFFGSNFVVTKKYKSGDGFFFQWVMVSAVFIAGLVTYLIQCGKSGHDCPRFEPLAMVGGAVWCLGNVWVVPIVKCIGLGLGLCIWGSSNMIIGWATSRFGLFGLDPTPVGNSNMNYIAVGLAFCAMITFLFIKSDVSSGNDNGSRSHDADDLIIVSKASNYYNDPERTAGLTPLSSTLGSPTGSAGIEFGEPKRRHPGSTGANLSSINNGAYGGFTNAHGLLDHEYGGVTGSSSALSSGGVRSSSLDYSSPMKGSRSGTMHSHNFEDDPDAETSWTDLLSPTQKKMFGIVASLFSGCCYGSNFTPPQYIVDQAKKGNPAWAGSSTDQFDYVFSHFTGIFVTGTCFLIIYSLVRKNKPRVYPEIIAPGFLSGIIWAIAQICFFIANSKLSMVITFPILAIGPGVIGALWGTLVFREIVGLRNYILLTIAFGFTIASSVLNVLSGKD